MVVLEESDINCSSSEPLVAISERRVFAILTMKNIDIGQSRKEDIPAIHCFVTIAQIAQVVISHKDIIQVPNDRPVKPLLIDLATCGNERLIHKVVPSVARTEAV